MACLDLRRVARRSGFLASILILGTTLQAATPAGGTLSAANPELNYASGPFAVSNPTSDNAGGVCASEASCDHYDLTVDYTGLAPAQEVSIAVSWTNANEDYDIYLMRSDGTVAGSSAGSANPEVIVVPVSELGDPAYRVRIIPFLATGGSTATQVKLGGGTAAPPLDPCAPSGSSAGGSAVLSSGLSSDLSRLSPLAVYGAYVHFSQGTLAEQNALLALKGLTVAHDFRKYATSVFATGPVSGFQALLTEPSVSYMEENRRLNYLGETASWATRARVAQEPVAGGPYSAADGKTLRGDGVTVVVVDSGVNAPHPDFAGRVLHNYKIVGSNAAPEAATVTDVGPGTSSDTTGGHGTHVAGIALGSGAASTGDYPVADAAPNTQGTFTGVAPAATLIAYGSGETLAILSADIAFQHILDNYDEVTPRIRVVSNSYGQNGGLAYNPAATASCLAKALIKRGVSVIYAASNDGGDGSADLTSPACKHPTPGVICVANYNDNGTGALNNALDSSSSRGMKGDPANYPDIAAPGADYTATCSQAEPGQGVCATGAETRWQPLYGTISGTSMATPHVAGAIALLYQARPELTPAQIEDLIQDSARKVTFNGAYDADPQNQGGTINFGVGAGLLNVQAALDALGVAHPGLPASGSEITILDGDADSALAGAADVVKLTMQEGTEAGAAGITYRITVRDAAAGAAGVYYSLPQNVNGAPFVTRIESSADGVTSPASGPNNTAAATSASRAGNVVTFFVPYSALGYPPVGVPIHNIRVLSNSDFAPSPSAPTTEASLEPMFGKPFTVLLNAGLPPPLNPCDLPGVTVVTDAQGDAQNTQPAFDIESLSVAEPETLAGKIVFSMQVADLATLPPNTFWAVRFNTPTPPANGDEAYFVGLTTVGGAVRYVYGTSYVESTPAASVTTYQVAGEIDQDNSSYDADGTITMVADKSLFAPLNPGDLINNFIGTTRSISQDEGPIAGGSQDTAEGGFYILREAAACAGGAALPPAPGDVPAGSYSVGGALSSGTLLGMLMTAMLIAAGWRRRQLVKARRSP